MARNYAALFHEYLEEFADLTDAEFGRLARALLVYSRTGEFPALNGNERLFKRRVMMQEDRVQESYDLISERNRENGKHGGRPPKPKETQINPEKPKETQVNPENLNQNQIQNQNQAFSNEKDFVRAKRFTPPTLAEVQSYVAERHSPVDPQLFIDFYAAKGWMVGKTPMKDWKAACRNAEKWERWARAPAPSSGNVFLDMLREEEAHGTQ